MIVVRLVAVAVGSILVVFAAVECIDRSIRTSGAQPATARPVIVVLGLPAKNRILRSVQHWRVDMAIRAQRELGARNVIFTGGTPYSSVSEAAEMAEYAISKGLPSEQIRLESRARNTKENVELSRALLEPGEYPVIVSDALHARRAANHWELRFPNDVVVVDPTYSFGEHPILKVLATVAELRIRLF